MSDIDYREEKIGSPAEDGEACEDFDSLAKDCVVLNLMRSILFSLRN